MCPGKLRRFMIKMFCAILITAPFYDNSSTAANQNLFSCHMSYLEKPKTWTTRLRKEGRDEDLDV